MVGDDSIADDDAFLDALVGDALAVEAEKQSIKFTHAFTDAAICDVLRAASKGSRKEISLDCNIFGATANLNGARAYLATAADGTILWLPQTSLSLLVLISTELRKPVHWISVYEAVACRAYLQFMEGRCTKNVLDPILYWTENVLVGDELIGKGRREFDSYTSFKASIGTVYVPRDEKLDYEQIDAFVVRRNGLLDWDSPLVQFRVSSGTADVRFIGEWPVRDRKTLEDAMNES